MHSCRNGTGIHRNEAGIYAFLQEWNWKSTEMTVFLHLGFGLGSFKVWLGLRHYFQHILEKLSYQISWSLKF